MVHERRDPTLCDYVWAVLPLDGIRVIDTSTGPLGGLATMVLADFGADVVKVEPPGGDRFRGLPGSPLWLRGKRSIVLDLHTEVGRVHLQKLVAGADVVVVSGPPGRAARWGIDATQAEALQPSIIHCSLTGWGEAGPLAQIPGYVATVAAAAGRMQAFAGQIRRPGPVYAAVPVAVHVAAYGAVQGILSALIARDRGQGAQRVTTSLLQSLMPFDLVELLLVQLAERAGLTLPNPQAEEMPTLNYHPVMAKDGTWIQCGNLLEHLFLSFLDAVDLYGELLTDERFLESPAYWSSEAIEIARDRILERLWEKPADEWMAIFFENGNVAAEPFRASAEAIDHPDLVENGAVITLVDPERGPVTMIGAAATLTVTPARIFRPAPRVGQHADEVLQELLRRRVVDATVDSRSTRSRGRPLDGITVVEFASVIAAPLGASMLGDLGARVIRVEPIEGDSFRHLRPNGIMAVKTTASKESICLDLKRDEGRAVARLLIAQADVLIHNYRPGVPERLGIGFDELHGAFPTLVWVSVNGYGPNGPGANRPATHPVAGASMGGAAYQAGRASTTVCATLAEIRETARQLMRANEPSPDPNTSAVVGAATLLGLLARNRLGVTQAIYVDMMCANAHANADAFLRYEGIAERPAVDEGHFGTGPLHRLYATESGWIFLAVTNDGEWERLCRALQSTASGGLLGDPKFETPSARFANGDLLVNALTHVFAERAAADWQQLLGHAGVACVQADASTPGPFYVHHEQMIVNGFVPLVNHARFGEMRRWGPIVMVDGGPDSFGPGVLAGEHTDRLLTELGFDANSIARLRSAGIAASEPVVL